MHDFKIRPTPLRKQPSCRPWVFQRAINQGRVSPRTSPKWGSDTLICRFAEKSIKSLVQSFIVYKLPVA